MSNDLNSQLSEAIRNGDEGAAETLAKEVLEQGMDPLEVI